MLKSLSAFTNGSIEALVFGRLPLFYSRVEIENFKIQNKYKDKLNIEIECFKINPKKGILNNSLLAR